MAADEPAKQTAHPEGPYLKRPKGPRSYPRPFPYRIHGLNRSVEASWSALCGSHKNNMRRCYDHLATKPKDRTIDPGRLQELRSSRVPPGTWQYEVGGGARIWYRVDDEARVVQVIKVHTAHPKETE